MMRFVIDCRMIDCSGIGTYLKGVLPFLLNFPDTEWLLIGSQFRLKEYLTSNVKILDCNIPVFSIKELLIFPVKEINKYDVYFSPNYNLPIGLKIPIVATIHDVIYLDIKNLTTKLGSFIRKEYLKYATRKSNQIITVSQFSARRILHHFPFVKNLTICENGVSTKIVNASIDKSISSIQVNPYFLYIGNIKPHKGLDLLIDVFNRLPDSYRLVIVGNKDNFRTTDSHTALILDKLSENSKISFSGRVSDGALKALIIKAKALIQPSRYEGFGLPPLEAMFLGTPVIISDIEVFKELYSDFPVTFFKSNDSSDLIEKIISAPDDRIILNSALINRYSYQRGANEIFKVITHAATIR